MGRLQRGGHLGVRGREQTGDLLGQRLVRGEARELALPQVEIAPGQSIEIAGIVVVGGHAQSIPHRRANVAFATAMAALSHCGSGAKVTHPL
ncbi:hypothetical protein [Reyranella sp.]|uniref:hypothetical protein n=1 Tax=Reyranella sp. TaxID=1929291 RepID=UPI003BA95A0F